MHVQVQACTSTRRGLVYTRTSMYKSAYKHEVGADVWGRCTSASPPMQRPAAAPRFDSLHSRQNYRQVVRGEVKNPSLGNFPLRGEGIPPLSVNLFPFRKKSEF